MSDAAGHRTSGRARAITLVSPLKRHGVPLTAALFTVVRLMPERMRIRQLGSVHFTRWTILASFPRNPAPAERERRPRPYLLWESDYTGLSEPYIEAFAYVIGGDIDWTWKWAHGYPRVRSVARLRRYIDDVSRPLAYHYAAHPTATVKMILSGLEVVKEHEFLAAVARDGTPEEFGRVYRGFLTRRQADL